MKYKLSHKLLSAVLAFVMVLGVFPVTTLWISAQNITGLMYASGIRENEAVVLWGDTTLVMDTDLTVPSIEGDYDLTVYGSGMLTVNGSGNGIDVKNLFCESDLFIQTGRHAIEVTGTVYIENDYSFIVGDIYADGDIEIQSNNATIGGNDYAMNSTAGDIILGGATFDIGANGVAVYAKNGDINMNGNFTVNSNDGRTIDALKGAVTVYGSLKSTSGAKFDPDVHFIERDHFSIGAAGGFNFYGTTLDVEGYGGIDAYGDVNITADNVSVLTEKLTCIEGHTVFIDCDVLRLENMPNVNDPTVDQYGISCYESATVNCPDATIITCDHGIYANGFDVTLNGNFTILGKGNFGSGIWASNLYLTGGQFTVASNTQRAIDAGRVEVRGNLSVSTKGEDYCLFAREFIFNGTTLAANGYAGINSNFTEIEADSVVITTDVGTPLCGYEVYVTANHLWAENKATKVDSDWLSQGGTQFGINAVNKLALTVKNGTVIGYNAALRVVDPESEFDHHYIYVDGALTAISRVGAGMYVPEGTAEGYGGPIVSVGETHGIYAKDVYFDGGSLRVDGNTGIYASRSVELSGDDIKITAFGERNSGIWCENGPVTLEGKVVINTAGWYGINVGDDMTFKQGYFEIRGPENNAQAVMVGGELSLDGTLEIVDPKYGHVNGNDIYGNGDSPALEFLMYSAIPEVSVYIDHPREGKLPTRNASGIYFLDPRCTVEEIIWYEDGEELVSQDAVFRAGHSYTVRIIISADDPYHFSADIWGKVNDKNVSTGLTENKVMRLTADLGECPEAIDTVELSIKAPEEGKAPSTGVTAGSSKYGVISRNVRWTVSTNGVDFMPMASGEKFVGGKYYRVFMDVTLAGNQYKFPITTATGSVQPDVISYVNGNLAVTEKAYDQDPQTVITVYFDFGKCNDYMIEEVHIVDLIAPVAGQYPPYTANVFGTGYHIDTTRNSYEDIYWKNPPEKWYFVKNGVQWWDVTGGSYDYVYDCDTFIPGHTYSCTIYVRVDDGYTFAKDGDGMTILTATLNGKPADIVEGWTDTWNTRVTYEFTCEATTVSTLQIYDLDVPQKGKTPDYSATLGSDLYLFDSAYGLNGSGIYWYDCEGRQLKEGEVFGDAGPYRVAVKLIPADMDGIPLCEFAEDLEVQINGKDVTPYGDWDDIMVGSGAVWAFYTFKNASSAPELGKIVSGKITSFGNSAAEVLVQLLESTSKILYDEIIVTGNEAEYCFTDVAIGVYILRISKENHVSREYMVVVNSSDVLMDAKIYQRNDLDGDGAVTIADVTTLLTVLSGTRELMQGIDADVEANGSIDIGDVTTLLSILSNN